MSNPDWEADLQSMLREGLLRRTTGLGSGQGTRILIQERELLNFSSNDYLGLSRHPAVIGAAAHALHDFGAGAGASRLISGSLPPHHALEERLAAFKGVGRCLSFSSGYATAMGVIPAILKKGDVVVLDRFAHACLVDAARLSEATLRVFGHNRIDQLEDRLRQTRSRFPGARILIVTESIFSMDGDCCPLAEVVALKERYGAMLLLDEAHATGVTGPAGRGLAAQLNLADRIDFHMGTLGKAAGSAGGFVCGSSGAIDFLINSARSFIFSTAPPPAVAAAAIAGIEILSSPEGDALRTRLSDNVRYFHRKTGTPAPDLAVPILPVILGENQKALSAAEYLLAKGIFVPCIRFPSVPRGTARLRVTLSSLHQPNEVCQLAEALHQCNEDRTRK